MSGYARIPYRVCDYPGCVNTFLIGHRGSANFTEKKCPEHRDPPRRDPLLDGPEPVASPDNPAR